MDGLRLFVSELHLQGASGRGDGHVFVAEPAHQVEWFPRRLLEREPHRVLLHVLLDGVAHLRRRAEEAVRGDQPVDSLVRPLEVVGLNEERHAPLAIGEVGEHGT
jgi:hypothetical protein